MKKHFLFSGLIILLAPTIAYASWWNPFSWKIFSDISGTNTSVINAKAKLSSEILTCNGEKWNQCPEGQRFVCPENNQSDAYCETVSNVVKNPVNRCEEFKQKRKILLEDHKALMEIINEIKASITEEYRSVQHEKNLSDFANNLYRSLSVNKPQDTTGLVYANSQGNNTLDQLVNLRQQKASERLGNRGLYNTDNDKGYSSEQIKFITSGADSFYDEQIARYDAATQRELASPGKLEQLTENIEQIFNYQENLNSETKQALEKLQAEYPKCSTS